MRDVPYVRPIPGVRRIVRSVGVEVVVVAAMDAAMLRAAPPPRQ
jgi:hypothetical protein